MSDDDDRSFYTLLRLPQTRQRYENMRAQLDDAQAERDAVIREAHAAGISMRDIALAAGVSHQRVAQVLAETPASNRSQTPQEGK